MARTKQNAPSLGWSWKLGRLAGIEVYVHATFLLLLLWLGLVYWRQGGMPAAVNGIFFILLLFGCVVLHELGHALTARRFGIQTRNIVLLPIGGVASLEKMPDDPREEILVALAGPAVNVVIAGLLWLWLSVNPVAVHLQEGPVQGGILQNLLVLNIFLAVFNLLPAFPMDGGRVLRALLSFWMDKPRATRTAATVGQMLALWLGFMGLFYNPILVFIALFVWIGAAAEAGSEEIKSLLHQSTLRGAVITHFETLAPDDALSRAIALTLDTTQKEFPVMEDGVIVGVLTQEDLLRGLKEEGAQAPVSRYMQTDVETAEIDEPLDQVLERLQHCGCRLLAVIENGRLAGIVNLDNLMELIRIETALRQQQGMG